MAAAVAFAAQPVAGWLNRPVAEVSVEGAFRYLDRKQAESLLSKQLGEGFLQLDLAGIKSAVEANPWVERAALSRRWPDQLHVRIYEQEPIARWGQTGFLNRSGQIIKVAEQENLASLPLLEGADRDAELLMERYQDLAQLLRYRGLTIRSLRSDQNNAWQLTLTDGVTLMIGRNQVVEKMQRFATVFDQRLTEHWNRVEQVDLRYHNGVAVDWKEQQETEQ
ncbi:cell division protein FtsQ/DivIB [Marinimicrobium locisalis]|uniref:cell division protein FtsQ/DivIB n=1 Tax=Marinimicrobium locisalis TaxID=546022 RepID=UPI0032215165